jgi:hypothetical protein
MGPHTIPGEVRITGLTLATALLCVSMALGEPEGSASAPTPALAPEQILRIRKEARDHQIRALELLHVDTID